MLPSEYTNWQCIEWIVWKITKLNNEVENLGGKLLPKGLYHITICIFKALVILTTGTQLRKKKKTTFKLFSNAQP